jgi:hypothetical protein
MKKLDQSGFIMALALVILVTGSMIVVPGMSTASSLLKINRLSEVNTQGAYAAEAGIADVMWKFNNNITPTFPYSLPGSINGLTVTISQVSPPVTQNFTTTYTLQSSANQSSVSRGQVVVQVIHNSGASPFYYGLVALNGNITMSNSAHVYSTPAGHGDVFANGNIICTNSSQVNGNAGATGTIDSSHVTGSSSPHQTPKAFEDMDMTWYQQHADAGGTTGSVNLWRQSNVNLGPKHITGDLTIGNSTVNLTGTVWVDGHVDINTSTTISGTNYLVANNYIAVSNNSQIVGNPTFISNTSYIMLSNSTSVGSLYAPHGTISISNYAIVNGSIVGQAIQMSNNAAVNYPVNLQTNPPPGFSGGNSSTITSFAYN